MKRLILAMLWVAGCSPADNQPASDQIEKGSRPRLFGCFECSGWIFQMDLV